MRFDQGCGDPRAVRARFGEIARPLPRSGSTRGPFASRLSFVAPPGGPMDNRIRLPVSGSAWRLNEKPRAFSSSLTWAPHRWGLICVLTRRDPPRSQDRRGPEAARAAVLGNVYCTCDGTDLRLSPVNGGAMASPRQHSAPSPPSSACLAPGILISLGLISTIDKQNQASRTPAPPLAFVLLRRPVEPGARPTRPFRPVPRRRPPSIPAPVFRGRRAPVSLRSGGRQIAAAETIAGQDLVPVE